MTDRGDVAGRSGPVKVRAAEPRDAPALARLHSEAHGSDQNEVAGMIKAHLAEIAEGLQFAVCVAEVDDLVVGYGMVGFRPMAALGGRNLPDGLYLAGVYTTPAYRRRGIGHALTTHRIQWAEAQADGLYFYVHAENRASIALHEDMDFVEISRDIDVPPDIPGPRGNQVLFGRTFR